MSLTKSGKDINILSVGECLKYTQANICHKMILHDAVIRHVCTSTVCKTFRYVLLNEGNHFPQNVPDSTFSKMKNTKSAINL